MLGIVSMYFKADKHRKRGIIDASGKGELDKLKEYFSSEFTYMDVSLYYCARAGNLECVKYLLSTGQVNLSHIENRKSMVYDILKRPTERKKKLEMLKWLHNNTKISENRHRGIPNETLMYAVNHYKSDFFKQAYEIFGGEKEVNLIAFKELTSARTNERASDFLNTIMEQIREEKINSILE